MEALVGVGAKLMRGDLAALCLVETKENEFQWEKTDKIIGELLARGIAIDAIIPTVPGWARRDDYKDCKGRPDLGCADETRRRCCVREGSGESLRHEDRVLRDRQRA